MEVDDDEGRSLLLYCDEGPFVSTPPPPPTTTATVVRSGEGDEREKQQAVMDGDDEAGVLMVEYKGRERCYAPATGYLTLLHQDHTQARPHPHGLSSARSRAVHYIIYAFGRLGLAAATAFNAVNYLDRFLSINCHLRWEVWMVEVVSVACLSVACKLDQVDIPSLHDLQMEEVMSNSFRPSTIRDMELTLLKALQWRLACVTPYTFLHLLLPGAGAGAGTAASRCTRLLLTSLSEPSLLRFDASVVAASALWCVAQQDHLHSHLSNLIPRLRQMDNEVDECLKMMTALYASLDVPGNQHKYSYQLWSPTSVIPFQTGSTVNRSAVSRRLFGRPILAPDGAQDEDKPHTQEMK